MYMNARRTQGRKIVERMGREELFLVNAELGRPSFCSFHGKCRIDTNADGQNSMFFLCKTVAQVKFVKAVGNDVTASNDVLQFVPCFAGSGKIDSLGRNPCPAAF